MKNAYQQGDISKLKLIIWDLDDTFWNGTLSDNDSVQIPAKNKQLIIDLTEHGIVNAICSKNDPTPVEELLKANGLDTYFVFNSINWQPKGQRIKQLIEDMGLRPVNVLFIDDNHLNLEEAEYILPEIKTTFPSAIDQIVVDLKASGIPQDTTLKRLNQYKVLEKKNEEKKYYSSNEDFLFYSNIRVDIHTDCKNEVKRIHELIMRSNQLNFTKLRSSYDEVCVMLSDSTFDCGTVWVHDRFGDYGMVGFYAVKDNTCIHFLFSCRTIGMGIEQYVYNILGCPQLETVGEVIGNLDKTKIPGWINQETEDAQKSWGRKQIPKDRKQHSVLFSGPCDLLQIFNFLKTNDQIDTEFTYVNEKTGVLIRSIHHTEHIVETITLPDEVKKELIEYLPFSSEDLFSSKVFAKDYDYIFLSTLHDAYAGVYSTEIDGITVKVTFGMAGYPLTEEKNFAGYERASIPGASNCKFSKKFLCDFKKKYKFEGFTSPEKLRENISFILTHLPQHTRLVLMLGSETKYQANEDPALENVHDIYAEYNRVLRNLAAENERVMILDFNNYVHNQSDFVDSPTHYASIVYYKAAKDIMEILDMDDIQLESKGKYYVSRIKQLLRDTVLGEIKHSIRAYMRKKNIKKS